MPKGKKTAPAPEPKIDHGKKVEAIVEAKLSAPKKGEIAFDRGKEIELLKATINKQFKTGGAIVSGNEFSNVFILRRPTGITSIDVALGGGFPAGGLSQIIGKDSVGKDYLANRTAACVQQIYGEQSAIAFCPTEMAFDKPYAKYLCGVNIAFSNKEIEELEAARKTPVSPEERVWLKHQTGHIEQSMFAVAEEHLEAAAQLIESNCFQLVVINSFGALLTAAEAEAEGGIADKHRGGAAMAITQFMHRLHAALNSPDKRGKPNLTTVIGINQYRDNVNAGMYGNPMKLAGGWALRHGKLVDLHVEQGARIKTKVGSEDRIIGKEIHWELTKGKAGCHDGPKGTYSFFFGENNGFFGADI